MPFCTNCGTQVETQAAFCRYCGAAQAGQTQAGQAPFSGTGVSPPTGSGILDGVSDRMACMLSYIPVFGIIPAVIFLASQRFRHNYRVRFNAFQGLYVFVAWLIASSAFPSLLAGMWDGPERAIFGLARAGLIVCWIYLLVRASQHRDVRLPIVGDLAARSTHEQL